MKIERQDDLGRWRWGTLGFSPKSLALRKKNFFNTRAILGDKAQSLATRLDSLSYVPVVRMHPIVYIHG